MKTETRVFISLTVILVVALALCMYFHGVTKGELALSDERSKQLEQQVDFYRKALDLSQKEVAIYEDSVKMHMENEALLLKRLELMRKQMADAVKVIETLPPEQQTILFDEFTGDSVPTVIELREGVFAIVNMERIVRANQTMTEVTYLREDVDLLERITQEKESIIDMQMNIIGQKDLQLSVKDSVIDLHKAQYVLVATENMQLKKTANLHKMLNYVIGGIAVVVLVLN